MQCRYICFAWWLQWLCRPTYELGRNTEGRAWKRSTKEKKEYIVLKKTWKQGNFKQKCAAI